MKQLGGFTFFLASQTTVIWLSPPAACSNSPTKSPVASRSPTGAEPQPSSSVASPWLMIEPPCLPPRTLLLTSPHDFVGLGTSPQPWRALPGVRRGAAGKKMIFHRNGWSPSASEGVPRAPRGTQTPHAGPLPRTTVLSTAACGWRPNVRLESLTSCSTPERPGSRSTPLRERTGTHLSLHDGGRMHHLAEPSAPVHSAPSTQLPRLSPLPFPRTPGPVRHPWEGPGCAIRKGRREVSQKVEAAGTLVPVAAVTCSLPLATASSFLPEGPLCPQHVLFRSSQHRSLSPCRAQRGRLLLTERSPGHQT